MRALSPTILSRRDAETARLIEVALRTQRIAGRPAAAAILARAGVHLDLALRVLSRPHAYRGCIKRRVAHTQ